MNISDVILKDKLTFNIIGDLDFQINGEKEYEISLKNNNKENVNSICKFKITGNNLDNQIISCSAEIDKKKTEYLTFENGMFTSKSDNKDILILYINDVTNMIIPKKKGRLSVGAIIGIIIAVLIIIVAIAYMLLKSKKLKISFKKLKKIIERKKKPISGDGSRDIIFF